MCVRVCVFIYLLIYIIFICILKPNNLHVIHSYTSTPRKISFVFSANYNVTIPWNAPPGELQRYHRAGRHLDALDRLGDDQGQSPDLNVSGQVRNQATGDG